VKLIRQKIKEMHTGLVKLQGDSNMTGTIWTHKSVPVIFESPCILYCYRLTPSESKFQPVYNIPLALVSKHKIRLRRMTRDTGSSRCISEYYPSIFVTYTTKNFSVYNRPSLRDSNPVFQYLP
jgi:hypothetical protein